MYSVWVFDIHRELCWIEFGISDESPGPAEPGRVGYAREAVLFRDWDPCVGHSMLRPPEEREGGCTEVCHLSVYKHAYTTPAEFIWV